MPCDRYRPFARLCGGKGFCGQRFGGVWAIRADGKGDVTATHVAWKGEDGLPDACSPLASDEFVFLLALQHAHLLRRRKRRSLWTEDFDDDCTSSPTMAGKLMYLFGTKGKGLGRGADAAKNANAYRGVQFGRRLCHYSRISERLLLYPRKKPSVLHRK